MASENIFAPYIQPLKSVDDWQAERDTRALRQAQLQGLTRQNALADLMGQQQRQTMADSDADRNALRALAAGWTADTTTDQRVAGLRNSGRAGLMGQADALEKSALERKKAEAAAGKDQAETLGKQLEAMKFLSQSVLASPTPQNAALAVDAFERMTGRQMPEERQRLAQLQTPEQVRQWAAGHSLKADELIPKLQMFSTGKQQVPVDMNSITNPNPQALTMTTTPGEDLTAQTSRANNAATVGATIRGQNLTDARARDANSLTREANATVYDAERGVLVNKGTGLARPAATMDGKPLGAKDKDPTEGERNAAGFSQRMTEATKLLDQFEKTGRPTYGTQAAGSLPVVGASLQRSAMNADQQRYRQAQEDWVRAKLRKESGAAIGHDEMANEIATYFPQPGDLPETVAQKRQARAVANDAMVKSAGRGLSKPAAGSVLKFDANGNLVQ